MPSGVYLAPVLPGLTDAEDAIASVAEAAREQGATAFSVGVLRLAPLVREHSFGFIEEIFPDLLPRYQRAYPRSDVPRAYLARLDERIARVRQQYGFESGREVSPQPVPPKFSGIEVRPERTRQPSLALYVGP